MNKVDWYLKISKEKYKEIYEGTPAMDLLTLFENSPSSDSEVVKKFLRSKLWRLNNIYKIRDKNAKVVKFRMNEAQHKVYSEYLKHKRLIILKSRQQGVSTLFLMMFFDDAIFIRNTTIGLLAQDRESANNLLERIKLTWDDIPPSVKNFLDIKLVKNNTSEFSFSNNSKMYVKTSFRSTTLQRLHISEFGKISTENPKQAKEIITGSIQAVGGESHVIIESTAEGKDNEFAKMWTKAIENKSNLSPNNFSPVFLSWVHDTDCSSSYETTGTKEDDEYIYKVQRDLDIELTQEQKWWAYDKRNELEDEFDREYPYNPESAFFQSKDGSYYGSYMMTLRNENRIQSNLYDKEEDVYVSMDIGYNDMFVMVMWQLVVIDYVLQIRIIDEIHNSCEELSYYTDALHELSKKNGYRYKHFILPHDADNRTIGSTSSVSRQFRDLGMRNQTVLKNSSISEGILLTRNLMKYMYIDKDKCSYLIKAFDNYSKEWNKSTSTWKNNPKHDEYSHPMDACRYFSVYFNSTLKNNVRNYMSLSKTKINGLTYVPESEREEYERENGFRSNFVEGAIQL